MVLRLNPLSMGVPVNPSRTAFGSAVDIRAPRMPYCVRWASSTMTITSSDAFSTSRSPFGTVSACSNFWIVVMIVRPDPVVRSLRRWLPVAACSGAGKPQRSNVPEICRSSCLRSVTTTMVGLRRRGSLRSFVASQSIVSDLPEPCVCQTTPPRSSGLRPANIRSTVARTARYCWYLGSFLTSRPRSGSYTT